jgi:creatinine amidohydrolase/Fe(II)-dependent formamide hydrolase-like protein
MFFAAAAAALARDGPAAHLQAVRWHNAQLGGPDVTGLEAEMRHVTFRLVPAAALFLASGGLPFSSGPCLAQGQVYRLAELNTEQIRALNRQTTVIIIPGGVLEEHGPYLPSYTDGYANERLTAVLAAAIAARPGWTAVVFPAIPLGSGGANVIGAKYSFPGSYGVRPAVVRAIFMDLATEFGEQGFRWIFVVHGHGGPHNRVLDEAGDYFRDIYGGHMVHLMGLRPAKMAWDSVIQAEVPSAARAEDGFTVHAGLAEHSAIMALRPDLVPASIAQAPSVTAESFSHLQRIAASPGWPGYFGAPRHASAELGRRLIEAEHRQFVTLALRILDGLDERQVPRLAVIRGQSPGPASVWRASAVRDSVEEARQRAWLARRGQR